MYKAFFGLTDTPFSIAPNPHYLFLSERHREALAHLTYGLGDTGGFVLLTGEVGTGKTTISRSLLKQLPDNTDTAFILNPSLTELELLATLCDELGIEYQQSPSLKQLTDCISRFLQVNHQQGRNTLLIIDEAQHLRAEVLEQLRLLTNLETDTKKLLQVILIGQPELQQLLKRQELRQLAQRITARYHLLPLTCEEVDCYVQHRLQVAGRTAPLFSSSSIKALHRFSGGIPRIINLLCERAMMAAYARNSANVDSKMVKQAASEVLGIEVKKTSKKIKMLLALVATLTLIVIGLVSFKLTNLFESKPVEQSVLSQGVPTVEPAPALSYIDTVVDDAIESSRDIEQAYASLLQAWGKVPYIGLSACQSAQQQGLSCFQLQGTWSMLQKLNYPVVAYLIDKKQISFYATVLAIREQEILLQLNEQQIWVSYHWFETHFSGMFELLWQDVEMPFNEINHSSAIEDIQWLENSLAKIAGQSARALNHFDAILTERLRQFQQQHGLWVDGIARKETLQRLALYLSDAGPRLSNLSGQGLANRDLQERM